MVSTKFLLMAYAAYVQATPVATAPEAETTEWTPLDVKDMLNLGGIDMDTFKDPANWNTTASPIDSITPADAVTIMGGPCQQGTCPDYKAGFDLVYTFSAVPVNGSPGSPPLTIFESSSAIRVNDCNKCYRHKVGSNLGNSVPGGCWNFTSCGRKQTICVDPGKTRAHRIWKDKNVKKCYRMKVENLGSCGTIKSRVVLHPTGTTACNW
ncbi:hypothetical protein IL306_012197 [Fusarium sp. DS 682]|nr:hypothetical protein IL306_012197 [Fusarium sp. DS 682]